MQGLDASDSGQGELLVTSDQGMALSGKATVVGEVQPQGCVVGQGGARRPCHHASTCCRPRRISRKSHI
jgi:hypothetical protein